jgi:hypothetical protein
MHRRRRGRRGACRFLDPDAARRRAASALPQYTSPISITAEPCSISAAARRATPSPNEDPDKVDRTRLGGGLALKSPFGTFYVPNISPDPKDGIGAWSEANFVTALWKGTSERGNHLYPALPYTSYQHMRARRRARSVCLSEDLAAGAGKVRRHDLSFPFNIRRLLGGWKLLFLHGGPFVPTRRNRRNGIAAPIW